MTRPNEGIAHSVRVRLLRRARERGDDYQLVLTRFLNERVLFRLSRSRHAGDFVLKGAMLLTVWTGEPYRATRDIDLLGVGDPTATRLRDVFHEVLSVEVSDDGTWFDLDTLEVGPIRPGQEYGGSRVTVRAGVGSARVRLQIDVGFGDAITPAPEEGDLPTLLEFPSPRLRMYPRPTVVAEKLHAIVSRGLLTTRMKDFHDLLVLSRSLAFDGALLRRAIRATFERRVTPLPTLPPPALTEEFSLDASKQAQWRAFGRKSGATSPGDLAPVVREIAAFATAPLLAAAEPDPFDAHWPPGGPWA